MQVTPLRRTLPSSS